ncbi:MAG: hypothetical protein ACKV2V_01340 [Blastocatellia bacterium]
MPVRGRPRRITSRVTSTKLFVDDLREMEALLRAEPGKTISDLSRELVHQALVARRLERVRPELEKAMRSGVIATALEPLEKRLGEFHRLLEALPLDRLRNQHAGASDETALQPQTEAVAETEILLRALLLETLGSALRAELHTQELLRQFLLARGQSEEAVTQTLAAHEQQARRRAHEIAALILQNIGRKGGAR